MSKILRKKTKTPLNVKLIRLSEAALVVAFFLFVKLLTLYYWAYSRTERFRWLVIAIMPTQKDRPK